MKKSGVLCISHENLTTTNNTSMDKGKNLVASNNPGIKKDNYTSLPPVAAEYYGPNPNVNTMWPGEFFPDSQMCINFVRSKNNDINMLMNRIVQVDAFLRSMLQPPSKVMQRLPDPTLNEESKNIFNKILQKFSLDYESCQFSYFTFTKWWDCIHKTRVNILNNFQKITLADLEYSNMVQLEQNIWKTVFYNVIELIRSWIVDPSLLEINMSKLPKEDHASLKKAFSEYLSQLCVNDVIAPGILFFKRLLLAQQHRLEINLGFLNLLNNKSTTPVVLPETTSRTRKLFYIFTHKMLLYLGDLERYKQLVLGQSDFNVAQTLYNKSQCILPKNGRPYHQLAVIALYTHRRFEATFMLIRSLAVSYTVPTSMQSLSFIFNEINNIAFKMIQEHTMSQLNVDIRNINLSGMNQDRARDGRTLRRFELWIHPNDGEKTIVQGNENLCRNNVAQSIKVSPDSKITNSNDPKSEPDLEYTSAYWDIPLVQLHRKFTIFFINAHGKLFTKIGMENFQEVASLALQCLSGLLVNEPCSLKGVDFCHLMMMNIFNVDRAATLQMPSVYNQTGNNGQTSQVVGQSVTVTRSMHHDNASRFALDSFALISERTTFLIKRFMKLHANASSVTKLCDDLHDLLAPLRLFVEWMILHPDKWNPTPNHRDPALNPCLDDWQIISELCTHSAKLFKFIFGEDFTLDSTYHEEARPTTASCIAFFRKQMRSKGINDNDIYPSLEEVKYEGQGNRFDIVDKTYDEANTIIAEEKKKYIFSLQLYEEILISGFKPMLDVEPKIYQYKRNSKLKNKTIDFASDMIRLEKLVMFGDYLCGIEPPILVYDTNLEAYSPVVQKESCEMSQQDVTTDSCFSPSSVDLDTPQDSESKDDTVEDPLDEEIVQLRQMKAKLESQLEQKEKLDSWRNSVIQEAAKDGLKNMEIEVHPVYILPDTNCYIDWLEGVATLAQASSNYTVIVPIVVVNELDYLSKTSLNVDLSPGAVDASHQDVVAHNDHIQMRAKRAISWLETEFEKKRNPRMRVLTSKGTRMETIAFRHEARLQPTPQDSHLHDLNNDDIILRCCRHFCTHEDAEPSKIIREVVLLTSDRNLRLKAINSDIPAKIIMSFIEWTRLPIVDISEECTKNPTNDKPSKLDNKIFPSLKSSETASSSCKKQDTASRKRRTKK